MSDQRTVSPHQFQSIQTVGELIHRAKAAMLMVHRRGARVEDILSLTDQPDFPEFVYLAPQAVDNTWYLPGIPPERVILLGFSQGACLTLEFAARNTQRFGVVFGLSGALIGPDDRPRDYLGSLAGTPVFLGCSDVDFHVPKERVSQTSETGLRLGGDVTERFYPNMDHTVNQDEIDFVHGMMQAVSL